MGAWIGGLLTRLNGIGDAEAGPGEARRSAGVLQGESGNVGERRAQRPVGEVERNVLRGLSEDIGLAGERQLVKEGAPATRASGTTGGREQRRRSLEVVRRSLGSAPEGRLKLWDTAYAQCAWYAGSIKTRVL